MVVCTPITSLLKKWSKSLSWSPTWTLPSFSSRKHFAQFLPDIPISVWSHYWSSESGLSTSCQTLEPKTGPVGAILHSIQLHCYLQTWMQELKSWHHPGPDATPPEPILPPTVRVRPIQWCLDDQISTAIHSEPALLGGPEGLTYVSSSLHLSLMDSLHTSLGSEHSGSQGTLCNHYWWTTMTQNVFWYIKYCSVCAISKRTCHLPEGKLVPYWIVHGHTSELTSWLTHHPQSTTSASL